MQCMNCGVEIPAQWKTVLAKNECPECQGEIMNEAGREMLGELKTAMSKMPNDPDGLAGWLLSNYNMQKVGSLEPITKFYGPAPDLSAQPRQQAKNMQQHFDQKYNNTQNSFLERAGFSITTPQPPQGVRDNAKEAAKKILRKEIEEQQNALYGSENDLYDDEYEEQVQPMHVPINKTIKTLPGKLVENNSVFLNDPSKPPLAPEEAQLLEQALTPKISKGMQQSIQEQRMNRLQRQMEAQNNPNKPIIPIKIDE